MIHAEDIMSDNVAVIYEDMLVGQVAHLMLRDRVAGFPVVSKEFGVVGIITMTDLFAMIDKAAQGKQDDQFVQLITHFKDLKVGEMMSKDVVFIDPQTTLIEIVHLVVDKNKHTFPVMKDEKLVGIVSRHDILNAIFSYLFENE